MQMMPWKELSVPFFLCSSEQKSQWYEHKLRIYLVVEFHKESLVTSTRHSPFYPIWSRFILSGQKRRVLNRSVASAFFGLTVVIIYKRWKAPHMSRVLRIFWWFLSIVQVWISWPFLNGINVVMCVQRYKMPTRESFYHSFQSLLLIDFLIRSYWEERGRFLVVNVELIFHLAHKTLLFGLAFHWKYASGAEERLRDFV